MVTSSKRPRTGSLPDADDFAGLVGDEPTGRVDDAINQLQKKLEAEQGARSEERFVWIMITVILVDVLWFRNALNPTIPIVVGA